MARRLRVVLGRDGGGLLVERADGLDVPGASSQGIIEMHRAAAREEEDMLHAQIDDKLDDVVG